MFDLTTQLYRPVLFNVTSLMTRLPRPFVDVTTKRWSGCNGNRFFSHVRKGEGEPPSMTEQFSVTLVPWEAMIVEASVST